jgi:hypothetical protein
MSTAAAVPSPVVPRAISLVLDPRGLPALAGRR